MNVPASPNRITLLSPPATNVNVPGWAWGLALLAIAGLYLLLQDNGVLLAQYAEFVHEFTHDGRHAFGVPCH
jgi:hypothetical protein